MQVQRETDIYLHYIYQKWWNGQGIPKGDYGAVDSIGLFGDDCKIPFILFNRHQSRLDIKFVRYMNDPETEWVVAIGVPQGTALW